MVGAVGVGIVLRFVNLGTAPLWFDETYTSDLMRAPWDGYLASLIRDNQAPAYYVSAKAWTELTGLSPWLLRIPGVLASIAFIPLVAATAELAAGTRRAARTAAWLAAISPFLIQHGQDARPYALLATFAVTALLLVLRFVTGRSRRLGVLWVVLAFAVVATHYYGIFFLAGQGLALLMLRPRPLRNWLPAGIAAGLLSGALVLLALESAMGKFAGEYVFGVAALPGVVWSLLTGYTLMPTSEELHLLGPRSVIPDLPMALALIPSFLLIALAGTRALDRPARTVLLTSFGVALLAPFAYRLLAGAGVHPRYFAAAFAPFLVVVAAGMVPDGTRTWQGASTILMVVVMFVATALHLHDTTHGREDIRSAGQWLDHHVPVDEEILVTSAEMEHLARFHWPNRKFRLYPPQATPLDADDVGTVAEDLPFPGKRRAIFMVGRWWITDPDGQFRAALAERYRPCQGVRVPGIQIYCYQARNDGAAIAHATQ